MDSLVVLTQATAMAPPMSNSNIHIKKSLVMFVSVSFLLVVCLIAMAGDSLSDNETVKWQQIYK